MRFAYNVEVERLAMQNKHNRKSVHVVWFKRDLRVLDHRALVQATNRGPVLPLLVVEPDWWGQPDMSARQYIFYRECASELHTALAALGQPLIVRVGDVVEILDSLRSSVNIAGLWSHAESGSEWTYLRDLRVADWCRQAGIEWNEFRQDGVVRKLESRNGWARRWDTLMSEPIQRAPESITPLESEVASQRMPTPGELGLRADKPAMRQNGGRSFATATLGSFLHERGEPYRVAMSSPISAEHSCSRLSPYLAWGAISMREVAQTTWRRQWELKQAGGQQSGKWRASLGSFPGRLHWHCHFMQKLEDEPRIEFKNLHPSYNDLRLPNESDAARLTAWSNGETGLPFVDACMCYLAATGWLNFRMRAMLMATASYHFWLDWRQPGLHLAGQFTDGIHWPQTQMQSGTTGINTVRIYNPIKQGYDHDPDGEFVRRWIPELGDIDGSIVHEPWKSPIGSGLLDRTYPMPIVDHMTAARDARQRIYGIRGSASYRDTADAIQAKHGSRKSGVPVPKRKPQASRRRRSQKTNEGQLTFDIDQSPASGATSKS